MHGHKRTRWVDPVELAIRVSGSTTFFTKPFEVFCCATRNRLRPRTFARCASPYLAALSRWPP